MKKYKKEKEEENKLFDRNTYILQDNNNVFKYNFSKKIRITIKNRNRDKINNSHSRKHEK